MQGEVRVDQRKVSRARQLLGLSSDAEAIEVALDLLILDDAYGSAAAGDSSDGLGRHPSGCPSASVTTSASAVSGVAGTPPNAATAAFVD